MDYASIVGLVTFLVMMVMIFCGIPVFVSMLASAFGGFIVLYKGNLVKDFFQHVFCWEIRIYKIAIINQFRISPKTTISGSYFFILFLCIICKQAFCNIQILNIINLIPALTVKPSGLQLFRVKHCDQADNRLIIFIISHCHCIRL